MTAVQTSIDINAPIETVWRELADFASHVEWMQDAVAIRFVGDQRSGEGTIFECDTKVGPFRLTDRIIVTQFQIPTHLAVRHVGVVTGTGAFSAEAHPDDQSITRLAWIEELDFPWWMAGRLGEAVAKPIFKRLWQANLRRLKSRIESQ